MNTNPVRHLAPLLTAMALALVTPVYGPTGETGHRSLSVYGCDIVHSDDFAQVRELGANLVVAPLAASNIEGLRALLDEAERHQLQVILWPVAGGVESLPWQLTADGWDLSRGQRMLEACDAYVRAGGRNLLGVVNMHEPFWLGGAPLTSSQLAELYAAIKQRAPNISQVCYINALAHFDSRGPDTRIVDGLCDWAIIWLHCFGMAEGTEQQALDRIEQDAALIAQRGLKMKLIFAIQAFGMDGTRYRMPSAVEMTSLGRRALTTGKLDGFLWYCWGNPAGYDQVLHTHRYDSHGGDRWLVVQSLAEHLGATGDDGRDE